MGSAGLADAPSGGARAAAGSYSAALVGLNGNAVASASVPAIFSASASPMPDASGAAGPLTVARLFRVVLCVDVEEPGLRPAGAGFPDDFCDVDLAMRSRCGRTGVSWMGYRACAGRHRLMRWPLELTCEEVTRSSSC